MDDNSQKNPWDELLDDLGAQPDQSAYERHQPPPQEIPSTVDWDEADELETEEQSNPADWNALAETLGLEVDESTQRDPSADSAEEQGAAAPADESTQEQDPPPAPEVELPDGFEFIESESQDAQQSEQTDDTFSSLDAPEQAEFLSELDSDSEREEQPSEEQDELAPLPTQTEQAMSEPAWEESPPEESSSSESEEGDDSSGISGDAARSAFDALFADGASSWGSAFLTKPKPEDSLSGSKDDDYNEDLFGAELTGSVDAKTGAGEGDEDDTDRPKRKRSRRRRRGGKGRKSASDTSERDEGDGTSSEEEQSESDSVEHMKKPRRRSSGKRVPAKDRAGDGEFDDDFPEDDIDTEGERPQGGGRRQRHRNIPTWSEAIGMIVDANLEQRAKSPSKSQSSRGRGGRGGRRRGGGKKSEKK